MENEVNKIEEVLARLVPLMKEHESSISINHFNMRFLNKYWDLLDRVVSIMEQLHVASSTETWESLCAKPYESHEFTVVAGTACKSNVALSGLIDATVAFAEGNWVYVNDGDFLDWLNKVITSLLYLSNKEIFYNLREMKQGVRQLVDCNDRLLSLTADCEYVFEKVNDLRLSYQLQVGRTTGI